MKTNNPIIDNLMDAQANAMNTWMDSAKKFQSAFASGNPMDGGQSIYKDMMEKQTAMFNGMGNTGSNPFTNPFMNDNSKPEEFFKNWYNQQMSGLKQMTDFNQSIYNSMVNYGKTANDYNNSFATMNNAWTNIYNSWMGTMNTSYDTFSKNINNPFNKDMFKNMFEGGQMYMKVQEMFQPMMNALKNSQNGLGKEYYAQMQNMSAQFPELFSGNSEQMKDLYSKMNNVFGKTFEPLLKLANPGKEKENVEATIALLDKVTEYSIKQSELQAQLYKTMQASMETLAKETQEKYKDVQADIQAGKVNLPTSTELYNEWVKTNEKMYSELFATDEFSKVKAEALNLSMDVKKHFEKQFENVFEQYPVVFKSEMDEIYKTMHDLKKTIKDLQTKLAMQNAASVELFEEDKAAKAKKK
ncbi:MAG: hypothetical protein K0S26_2088 [Bacteroidota bacterium]|nr:hypothetical protein [Bacteroidota bacterium]